MSKNIIVETEFRDEEILRKTLCDIFGKENVIEGENLEIRDYFNNPTDFKATLKVSKEAIRKAGYLYAADMGFRREGKSFVMSVTDGASSYGKLSEFKKKYGENITDKEVNRLRMVGFQFSKTQNEKGEYLYVGRK